MAATLFGLWCTVVVGADLDFWRKVFISAVLFGGIVLCIYVINELFSSAVLDDKGIIYKSAIFKRELRWEEVKHVYQQKGTLKVIGVKGKKNVNVSVYLKDFQYLRELLAQRAEIDLPDEDPALDKERGMIFAGLTDEEIISKIRQAKTIVFGSTVLSLLMTVGFMVNELQYPELPYVQAGLLAALLFAMWWYRGVIGLDQKQGEFGRSALIPFLLINLSLLFPVVKLSVWDKGKLIALGLMTTALIIGVFLLAIRRFPTTMGRRLFFALLYGLMSLGAGFGLVLYTNNVMDDSTPERYSILMTEKWMEQGRKGNTYYIILSEGERWKKISVSSGFYDYVQVSDRVLLDIWPGKLGVRWYKIVGKVQ